MKDIRWRIVLLLLVCAVAAAGFVVRQERQRQLEAVLSQQEERHIKVIAHRGGAACAPENTLAALEQAITVGADLAEIDLRMTRDGVVVALHDEDLSRTAGLKQKVCDVDSQAVRTLDAGHWFSSEYAGEQIPTLTEVLNTTRGRLPLILELKHTYSDQLLLEQVVEEICVAGMEGECILASSSLELLRQGKVLAPEVKNIYIGEKADAQLWALSFVDGYSICLTELTAQDVQQAHQTGRELYVWTVNEPWELARGVLLGADGLVTDNPVLARDVLQGSTFAG